MSASKCLLTVRQWWFFLCYVQCLLLNQKLICNCLSSAIVENVLVLQAALMCFFYERSVKRGKFILSFFLVLRVLCIPKEYPPKKGGVVVFDIYSNSVS
jgi:hypothetical protein